MIITDEYGKWKVEENIKILIEPSQKWFDENPPQEELPQPPTAEEKIISLENELASTNALLLDFMESMLGGI